MPKLIRLFGVLFTVFLLACTSHLTSHSPDPYARTLKYPVYIDKAFSSAQKDQIKDALTIWNKTFNGYQEFYVADDKWSPNMVEEDGMEIILNQREGFRIIKMAPTSTEEGVLGWVNDLGDEVVHLVPERCEAYGGEDGIRLVTAHEIGHSLGIPHNRVEGAVLFPYFTNQGTLDDGKCIDYFTALQLSKVNERFKLEHLNYCPPR